MKAPLPVLGCIVLASLVFSCASTSSARHAPKHAQSESDDELDGDSDGDGGTPDSNSENMGTEDGAEESLDSGMGTQEVPKSQRNKRRASPASGRAVQEIDDLSAHARTRYEVISNGFDHATGMPSVNDFDPLDDPSPRISCLSVKAADPGNVSEIVLKQMMVQIAGTADYGPLFPGTLDRVETRLVIGKNNGWVNSQNLTNEMRQVFEIAKAPGALVIRINENKFGIYQDIGAPAEIWIRKDPRGHLFFKVYRLDAQRNRTEVFIGYCYQRGGSPAVIR